MTCAPVPSDVKFPVLSPLRAITERVPSLTGDKTVIVAVQHLLSTTGSLLVELAACGFRPHRVFVTGKPYSTHEATADALCAGGWRIMHPQDSWQPGYFHRWFAREVARLWSLARKGLRPDDSVVILDDGGYARALAPSAVYRNHRTIAVEQTTSGVRVAGPREIPVILVASSAAKIVLEPKLIADAVTRRVADAHESNGTAAVVGLGNIGAALLRELRNRGRDVIAFDRDPLIGSGGPRESVFHFADLVNEASTLYGCTGEELFVRRTWITGGRPRRFVSCSSGDIEFRPLIRQCRSLRGQDPLSDLVPEECDGELVIRRGGFPVNFDGGPDSVPAEGIALTRALLLGAVLQAATTEVPIAANRLMLDPTLQRFVVLAWEKSLNGTSADVGHEFESIDAIRTRSAGEVVPNQFLSSVFSACSDN